MFYNTGIATYIWVLSNRKEERRKGKVQLIDATEWFTPLRKNLGEKGVELSAGDIDRVMETFLAFDEADDPSHSKIFDNADFGYSKVVVERPLRIVGAEEGRVYKAAEIKDAQGERRARRETRRPSSRRSSQSSAGARSDCTACSRRVIDGKTRVVEYEPDSDLRDTEQVPLTEPAGEYADGIEAFFRREVLPYAPDAWIDERRPRSATRSPSPGTSTSRRRCAPSPRSRPTSAPSKRRPTT